MGRGTAVEVVALDVAGKALALRNAGDVDQVAFGEQVDQADLLADRVAVKTVDPELANLGDLGQVLELARLGLGQPPAGLRAELNRGIPVALGCSQPGDRVRLDGDDAHRDHRSVGLEDLGYADLAADQSNAHRRQPTHPRVGPCARSLTHDPGALARVLGAASAWAGW